MNTEETNGHSYASGINSHDIILSVIQMFLRSLIHRYRSVQNISGKTVTNHVSIDHNFNPGWYSGESSLEG